MQAVRDKKFEAAKLSHNPLNDDEKMWLSLMESARDMLRKNIDHSEVVPHLSEEVGETTMKNEDNKVGSSQKVLDSSHASPSSCQLRPSSCKSSSSSGTSSPKSSASSPRRERKPDLPLYSPPKIRSQDVAQLQTDERNLQNKINFLIARELIKDEMKGINFDRLSEKSKESYRFFRDVRNIFAHAKHYDSKFSC